MSKSLKLAAIAAVAAIATPAFAQTGTESDRVVTAPRHGGGSSASIVGASRPGAGPIATQRRAPRNEVARAQQNGASTSANAGGAQPR